MTDYLERTQNVEKMRAICPQINVRPASHGNTPAGQEDLVMTLRQFGLEISPNYWKVGTTDIHWGKIGHWVSNLKYLKYLYDNKFDYGVLVEDDIIVPDNFISLVEKYLDKLAERNLTHLIFRLGVGDTCNIFIVKNIPAFFNLVKSTTIDYPFGTYCVRNRLSLEEVREIYYNDFKSAIGDSKMVPIKVVNDMIRDASCGRVLRQNEV